MVMIRHMMDEIKSGKSQKQILLAKCTHHWKIGDLEDAFRKHFPPRDVNIDGKDSLAAVGLPLVCV